MAQAHPNHASQPQQRRRPRPAHPDTPSPAEQTADDELRTPPHDLAAERAVLGTCLLGKPDLVAQARQLLPDDPGRDWWYHPLHGSIWRLICHLADRGTTPDPVTVADLARTTGQRWHDPDDTLYLHDLHNQAPLAPSLPEHAAILARHETRRRLDTLALRLRHAVTGDHEQLLQAATALRDDLDETLAGQTATGEADTWAPIDLQPALSGGIITQPPTFLARDDGVMLLYHGRLHSVSGEPEAGKSWLVLVGVLQALEDNQHVIYLDFEDTPEGIVGRLLAMGARPEWVAERLHYIRPDRPIDEAARRHLRQLVENNFVTIAVIDGVTEAMTMHGLVPLDNTDAALFYERLPRFLSRLADAPAVVMIDHVPKDEDRPKRYAIGAQHKLAGLDGAAYMLDVVTPFAPGTPGKSRLRVAKDRPGQVRKHAVKGVIAELHINGDDQVVTATLRAPQQGKGEVGPDGRWRPTILMERVSRCIEAAPGMIQRDIERAVRGKAEHIRVALETLVLENFVARRSGPRRAVHYFSLEPFRNEAEGPGEQEPPGPRGQWRDGKDPIDDQED